MNIAFFDFDGTIIKRNSLFLFINYVSPNKKIILVFLLAFYSIPYLLQFVSAKRLKEKVLDLYIKNKTLPEINALAKEFTEKVIPKYYNPKAIERLKYHKSNNDKIVIVSGSLDIWLKYWCEQNNYDLICSIAEVKNDTLTGKIDGENCVGNQKAINIKNKYNLAEYNNVFAYGDSKNDLPMLNLASKAFLNWKKYKE